MRRLTSLLAACLALVASASLAAGGPQAPAAAPAVDFEYYRSRIEPILLKKRADLARCYVCHSQGTPYRLQELSPGSTTWNEAQSRQNFEAVRRLVSPANPMRSRLIMVPLAEDAGGISFHPGGKHWASASDPEVQTLVAWIRGAK